MICIFGLVATLIWGVEIRGAKRWISIGEQFTLQFGEFTKIGTVVCVASLSAWMQAVKYNPKKKFLIFLWRIIKSPWLVSFVISLLPAILLALQPAYGTALLIMVSGLFVAFFLDKSKVRSLTVLSLCVLSSLTFFYFFSFLKGAGKIYISIITFSLFVLTFLFSMSKIKINWKTVIFSIFIGLLVAFLMGWNVLEKVLLSYHKERLAAFVGGEESAIEFQTRQSIVAIGSGQLFGRGFGQGTQTKLRYIPDYHTDFIFAAFAEEFGLIGSFLFLAVYLIFILLLIKESDLVEAGFPQVVVQGITALLIMQFAINLGVNLGLLPVIGVPLPFVSYGGSSLWTGLILIGIIQSFERKTKHIVEFAKIRGWK
jgi:rod shape determining protein RodA